MEKVASDVNLFICRRAANIKYSGNEEEKTVAHWMRELSWVIFCSASKDMLVCYRAPLPPALSTPPYTYRLAHTHKSTTTQHYGSLQRSLKSRMDVFLITHRPSSLCIRTGTGHSEAAAFSLDSSLLFCLHKCSKTSKQLSARRSFIIRYSQ